MRRLLRNTGKLPQHSGARQPLAQAQGLHAFLVACRPTGSFELGAALHVRLQETTVKSHGIRRGGCVIEQTEPRRLQSFDIALRRFQAGEMPQGAQALPVRLRDGVALDVIVKGYAPPGT